MLEIPVGPLDAALQVFLVARYLIGLEQAQGGIVARIGRDRNLVPGLLVYDRTVRELLRENGIRVLADFGLRRHRNQEYQ